MYKEDEETFFRIVNVEKFQILPSFLIIVQNINKNAENGNFPKA